MKDIIRPTDLVIEDFIKKNKLVIYGGKAGIPTTAMTGITPFLKPMATIGATGTTLHLSKKMFKELKKLKWGEKEWLKESK